MNAKTFMVATGAAALAITGTLLLTNDAQADRTVTWRSVDAKVERVILTAEGTKIYAAICGYVLSSDSSTPRSSCTDVELTGASKTAVQNWMNGAGLTAWKTAEGL